jgi:hypothetical protein
MLRGSFTLLFNRFILANQNIHIWSYDELSYNGKGLVHNGHNQQALAIIFFTKYGLEQKKAMHL